MQAIIVIVMVILAGLSAAYFYAKPTETAPIPAPIQQSAETIPADTQTPPPTDTQVQQPMYKDGTYTADGSYKSPAGEETITVSVTLTNDVVTDATFEGTAKNPGSVANQKKFADGFKQLVVGKPIDSISLTVVNGASLVPMGFMDALGKIKTQAMNQM